MSMEAHQLVNQTSRQWEYYTPPNIVEAARRTMGGIDLDPASSEAANRSVGASRIFTAEQDGLNQKWSGRVWMNHPFGRGLNSRWVQKMVSSHAPHEVTEACCITYACTSERWFFPLLHWPQCYLQPRTNYLLPDGTVKRGVTKGSVVTYFGPNVGRFADEFRALGVVKVMI